MRMWKKLGIAVPREANRLSLVALLALFAGCSSSSSSPAAPRGASEILSLDVVEPAGPATLSHAAEDRIALTVTVRCDPPSAGVQCHVGFDFLDEAGRRIERGARGFGMSVGAGVHTARVGGAPRNGFAGTTVGVEVALFPGTSGQKLTSTEFREERLRFVWAP